MLCTICTADETAKRDLQSALADALPWAGQIHAAWGPRETATRIRGGLACGLDLATGRTYRVMLDAASYTGPDGRPMHRRGGPGKPFAPWSIPSHSAGSALEFPPALLWMLRHHPDTIVDAERTVNGGYLITVAPISSTDGEPARLSLVELGADLYPRRYESPPGENAVPIPPWQPADPAWLRLPSELSGTPFELKDARWTEDPAMLVDFGPAFVDEIAEREELFSDDPACWYTGDVDPRLERAIRAESGPATRTVVRRGLLGVGGALLLVGGLQFLRRRWS